MKTVYLLVSLCLLFVLSHGQGPKLDEIKIEVPHATPPPPHGHKMSESTPEPQIGAIVSGEGSKFIAFTATQPVDITTEEVAPIAYKNVVTNIGGAYDPASGLFKAPMSGVYYFSFHCFYEGGDGSTGGSLYRNKEEIVTWFGQDSEHSVSASNSAVLELQLGDAVFVSLVPKSQISAKHSSFSGYLVHSW